MIGEGRIGSLGLAFASYHTWEAQVLADGKTGDSLLTGSQALLVCFVYLGRLDKGTPFPFTSHGDNPPSLVTLDPETS